MGHPALGTGHPVAGSRDPGEAEVAAGHLFGELEVEEAEDGGGDVAEGAAGADADFVALVGDEEEGDGVGGVGGVGASGEGVDEELGVAVVGGDDPVGVVLFHGGVDSA